jgi:hypothetical protein
MPWTFNPFSGTFDQKGSGGGGGASYIDGEVATYADLPLDGSAALNSAWLVRTASGVWPVSRKQAGIYIRTATGGSNRDSDYTYAGTMPDVFSDSQFLLYDNTDTSKNLAFDLGSITTGTTRTLTAPNASGRIQIEGQPIGNTTPAAGTFTTLASSGNATLNGFVIGATSIDSTGGSRNYQTNSGEGLIAVVSGAALAAGTNAARFAAFSNNRCGMRPEGELGWASSGAPSSSNFDLILRRDAAGVLAQYNAANPQEYRIYNTFTSSTNHERGFLRWSSNVFQIGTEKGSGGGSARALELQTDGVTRLTVQTGGTVALGSHLTAESGFIRIASAQAFQWLNRSKIYSLADGNVGLYNAGESSFNLLQFGGTTTSFPALKRSSTVLQARLANDSDFCPLQGQLRTHANAVTETITADKTLTFYDAAGTAYKVPCVAA